MASNIPRTFRRDSKLTYRMYMTMVMLGVLYGVFAIVLNAFGLSIVFIGVIVGLMVFAQYMLSDPPFMLLVSLSLSYLSLGELLR